MEASKLKPKDGRLLAVVLLLIVLILVYLGGVHWWFVMPQMQFSSDMQDLRDQQLRLRMATTEKPDIEKHLAEVKAYEQGNVAFLPESDANSASAALIQRFKQAVADHVKDEKRCQQTGTQNYTGIDDEPFKRVAVQVRMKCDLEPFSAILYDLENGKPYLFVDQVTITKQAFNPPPPRPVMPGSAVTPPPPPPPPPLDIQFNLSGYLHQPGKTK
ncbi:MAG: type II secretion system protein M [Rhodanobacter sp.]|jgi:general secretion pathway protein M|nr:type II secretion system protein M [Rhodanobacter sp.]